MTWAPKVTGDAAEHRLVLAETGKLYGTKKGQGASSRREFDAADDRALDDQTVKAHYSRGPDQSCGAILGYGGSACGPQSATGHWRVTWEGGSDTLAAGDTISIRVVLAYSVVSSMTGDAALYQITATNDPEGHTWNG